MKIIENFPYKVRVTDHELIAMDDGVRLSARLWIPEGAEEKPVPAIFEMIPYRKNDFRRIGDDNMHGYYSGHGYACVRVDIRGSGESEGILEDEYTQRELDDAVQILEWIGKQKWCNGNAGMMGISWGGFNALQVAALQPPELKAIISVAFTDDRYADDIHYMGGCLLGDKLSWASIMFGFNSLPPSPDTAGGKWREMWLERLENNRPWLARWLEHQNRDNYWKHGSVCEDYSNVKCPVMAISGWADGYTNAVFRVLENLDVPRLGLVGPWCHTFPNFGVPGPATGFMQESLRWWNKWLKGEESGIMDFPQLRAYMQHAVPPESYYDMRPGRWVCEPSWPSANIEEKICYLDEHKLSMEKAAGKDKALRVNSHASHGMFAGKWCSYGVCPDLPGDQRLEDGGALVFETEPLEEAVEILGMPRAKLVLSADKPSAMAAVRLSDVNENGEATRITYGVLNLAHRNGHEHPEHLEPGRKYEIEVPMNYIAQRFEKGHRIRFSVAGSYFPLAWLPPEPVTLTVHTEGSSLKLPLREPDSEREIPEELFEEAVKAGETENREIRKPYYNWEVKYDLGENTAGLFTTDDLGRISYESLGLETDQIIKESYKVTGNDYSSARGETSNEVSLKYHRHNLDVRTYTRTVLTCDSENFYITAELEAYENGEIIFSRNWDLAIPREETKVIPLLDTCV